MEQSGQEPLREMAAKLDLCLKVRDRIDKEIYPDPSNQIQKGGVIAQGVSIELDDLRNIASHGQGNPREHPATRKRGHRHPVAQDQLQQRVRLLYRGTQHAQGQGPLRLDPQADADRSRAVYHRRVEGIRGKDTRRREPDARAGTGTLRGAARRAGPLRRADTGRRFGRRPARLPALVRHAGRRKRTTAGPM